MSSVTSENEHLEARVCREKVLNIVGTCISDTDKDLWGKTLSDKEVLGEGLMLSIDDRRLAILNTNSAGKSTKSLERTTIKGDGALYDMLPKKIHTAKIPHAKACLRRVRKTLYQR